MNWPFNKVQQNTFFVYFNAFQYHISEDGTSFEFQQEKTSSNTADQREVYLSIKLSNKKL